MLVFLQGANFEGNFVVCLYCTQGDRGSTKSSMYGSQLISDTESVCSAVSLKGTTATPPPPLSRSASAERVFEEQIKGKIKRRSTSVSSLKSKSVINQH